ncbi:MAG: ribosome biogenesis GTP-binding protein YsxC [Myxococcales bacterium]|nr:ribosome biogenesis GTP-binding protein YsxC [Myxococcales bacterium]
MRTLRAELSGVAPHPGAFPPPGLPEIAIAGRSNAGKSSLINTLTGVRQLAHTARRPGKTRALVFFAVESRFVLVDLPGYGFAQVPRAEMVRWRDLVDAYLSANRPLRGFLALFDIRRQPDELDRDLLSLLSAHHVPWRAVWTKADQLKPRQVELAAKLLDRTLGTPAPGIPFSSRTRLGRDELLKQVEAWAA